MSKVSKVSKGVLEEIVKNSSSYTEVSLKLGYKNIRTNVVEAIKNYSFDVSHFSNPSHKNTFDYSRFRKGHVISSAAALKPLTYKRGHRCQQCGLTTWNNQPIPLEIHHIDGDKLNNEESNLLVLCPNCHALTDDYCGKNMLRKTRYISDEQFVEALKQYPNIRQALLALGLTPKGGNYTRARELAVKYNIQHILEP